MWKLGKGSQKVYDSGLHPDWKKIIDMACVVCPVEFTLTSGVRLQDRQFSLFKIGRKHRGGTMSNPNNWVKIPKGEKGYGVVTYCDGIIKKSKHQKQVAEGYFNSSFGMAVDLCAYVKGKKKLMYDRVHMAAIIGSFMTCANVLYEEGSIKHKLKSGADWDGDTQWLEPGTFHDLVHLQLYKP